MAEDADAVVEEGAEAEDEAEAGAVVADVDVAAAATMRAKKAMRRNR